MAVTIRLSRQGAKKNPQYLIVAVDSSKKRDGSYLEKLGHYFPKMVAFNEKIKVNVQAVLEWKKKGACFSPTAYKLLRHLK